MLKTVGSRWHRRDSAGEGAGKGQLKMAGLRQWGQETHIIIVEVDTTCVCKCGNGWLKLMGNL